MWAFSQSAIDYLSCYCNPTVAWLLLRRHFTCCYSLQCQLTSKFKDICRKFCLLLNVLSLLLIYLLCTVVQCRNKGAYNLLYIYIIRCDIMAEGKALSPFSIISVSTGAPVRMCRVVLLLTLISMVRVSTQIPPRLANCRNIYKAKDINAAFNFTGCKYTRAMPSTKTFTHNCGSSAMLFPLHRINLNLSLRNLFTLSTIYQA